MTKTHRSLALLAGVATSIALAASAGAASRDPAAVQPGVYTVEPNHTQVMFDLLHMGFSTFGGVFSKASGELQLDPNALGATKLDIDVPVDTVYTTSAKLDEELRSPDWLDAGKYPTMHFHATHVTRTGPDRADIDGELSLHGVTRPLTLKAVLIGAGHSPMGGTFTVGFDAKGVLDRSQYGVSKYVPLVSDQVNITIHAAFVKK